MRLFAAIWPPPEVLDHLDLALGSVGSDLGVGTPPSPVRWAARENWHITVGFFGDLAPGRLEELSVGLREAAAGSDPLELRLRGAGVFAHRTVWVGVSGEVDRLSRLVRATVEAGEAAGAWPDPRVRSRPHLTVGFSATPTGPRPRAARGRGGDEPEPADLLVRALSVYAGPAWTVRELLLVESRPGAGRGGGPLYTPVDAFSLVSSDPVEE